MAFESRETVVWTVLIPNTGQTKGEGVVKCATCPFGARLFSDRGLRRIPNNITGHLSFRWKVIGSRVLISAGNEWEYLKSRVEGVAPKLHKSLKWLGNHFPAILSDLWSFWGLLSTPDFWYSH